MAWVILTKIMTNKCEHVFGMGDLGRKAKFSVLLQINFHQITAFNIHFKLIPCLKDSFQFFLDPHNQEMSWNKPYFLLPVPGKPNQIPQKG